MNRDFLNYEICEQIKNTSCQLEMNRILEKQDFEKRQKEKEEANALTKFSIVCLSICFLILYFIG